jgi:hypothetical protein
MNIFLHCPCAKPGRPELATPGFPGHMASGAFTCVRRAQQGRIVWDAVDSPLSRLDMLCRWTLTTHALR